MPRPETTLRVLRREALGSVKDASKVLGVSRFTLHRAEHGGAVSDKTVQMFEDVFGLPWETLMEPFSKVIENGLCLTS